MATSHATDYGVVHFIPIETFVNPSRGVKREDRDMGGLDDHFEPDKPQSIGDWPRVCHAIRRGELFVIETTTPRFRAMLSFCPEHPDMGDYEIHYQPRGPVQKGRPFKVTAVPAEGTSSSLSMLKPFAVRYAVRTVADDRPRTVLLWLVGLNDYRSVDEREQIDDEVA